MGNAIQAYAGVSWFDESYRDKIAILQELHSQKVDIDKKLEEFIRSGANPESIKEMKDKGKDIDVKFVEMLKQFQDMMVMFEKQIDFDEVYEEEIIGLKGMVNLVKRWSGINNKPPMGILIQGPPGCGKTYMTRFIATRCGYYFKTLKCVDLHSYDRQTAVRVLEAAVDWAEKRYAEEKKMTIILLDEIDKPFGGKDEISQTLTAQLNTIMNGPKTYNGVLFVGTTNNASTIESSLQSRFRKKLYFPLPIPALREEYFRSKLGKSFPSTDIEDFVQKTDYYSYRNLDDVLLEAKEIMGVRKGSKLSPDDVREAIENISPDTTEADVKWYESQKGWIRM